MLKVMQHSKTILMNLTTFVYNNLLLYLIIQGQCQASDNYIAQFEDMLKHSCGQKVAGFIAEYIQVGLLYYLEILDKMHYFWETDRSIRI